MRDICDILKESKTIAVIGISDKPDRDSGRIAKFLKDKNYSVVGVHPFLKEVFGIPVYPSIDAIPGEIDIIDVFLSSDKIPGIIEGVIRKKPKTLWLQLGVRNDDAVKSLPETGIEVIQDQCIAVEYNYCLGRL